MTSFPSEMILACLPHWTGVWGLWVLKKILFPEGVPSVKGIGNEAWLKLDTAILNGLSYAFSSEIWLKILNLGLPSQSYRYACSHEVRVCSGLEAFSQFPWHFPNNNLCQFSWPPLRSRDTTLMVRTHFCSCHCAWYFLAIIHFLILLLFILFFFFKGVYFYFVLAMLYGMWDLSSPTRVWTCVSCIESMES